VFLNYSSNYRHPPVGLTPSGFSLPYSPAFMGHDFPAFNRYYGDAKTAFALLLPFGFPRYGYHLRSLLVLIVTSGAASSPGNLVWLVTRLT